MYSLFACGCLTASKRCGIISDFSELVQQLREKGTDCPLDPVFVAEQLTYAAMAHVAMVMRELER